MASEYLFLPASTRESGHLGPTEWLAQQAALHLPAGTLWGKGGPTAAVQANAQAIAQASTFFTAWACIAAARG